MQVLRPMGIDRDHSAGGFYLIKQCGQFPGHLRICRPGHWRRRSSRQQQGTIRWPDDNSSSIVDIFGVPNRMAQAPATSSRMGVRAYRFGDVGTATE